MLNLAVALAIVCAFNSICVRPFNSVQMGPLTNGEVGTYNTNTKLITVNEKMQNPAIIANIIAHEDVHVKQDREGKLNDTCINIETPAYQTQVAEWDWFESQEWAGPILPQKPEEIFLKWAIAQIRYNPQLYAQQACLIAPL